MPRRMLDNRQAEPTAPAPITPIFIRPSVPFPVQTMTGGCYAVHNPLPHAGQDRRKSLRGPPWRLASRTGTGRRAAQLPDHSNGHRPWHQLPGQLLGLQRRRDRDPHGKGAPDGYRRKVFLMTKIDGRSYAEATRQVDQSLERLQTGCIDLVQHHQILRYDDPHRIFDEEGANRALVDGQRAGKIRYIGFTGHKDPHIHLYMLDVARERGFLFDTVQMPLNVMDAHYRSFAKLMLPELVKQGTG